LKRPSGWVLFISGGCSTNAPVLWVIAVAKRTSPWCHRMVHVGRRPSAWKMHQLSPPYISQRAFVECLTISPRLRFARFPALLPRWFFLLPLLPRPEGRPPRPPRWRRRDRRGSQGSLLQNVAATEGSAAAGFGRSGRSPMNDRGVPSTPRYTGLLARTVPFSVRGRSWR